METRYSRWWPPTTGVVVRRLKQGPEPPRVTMCGTETVRRADIGLTNYYNLTYSSYGQRRGWCGRSADVPGAQQ